MQIYRYSFQRGKHSEKFTFIIFALSKNLQNEVARIFSKEIFFRKNGDNVQKLQDFQETWTFLAYGSVYSRRSSHLMIRKFGVSSVEFNVADEPVSEKSFGELFWYSQRPRSHFDI